MLIVFGGLPGVGKSALSREVAQALGATWLRIDAIEAAMWRAGVAEAQSGIGAYVVAYSVAASQLALGQSVVVDAVNPVQAARECWRDTATQAGTDLHLIEVICSDIAEHQRRVQGRVAHPDQPRLPSWEDVISRDYETWTGSRLTVDSIAPQAECVATILARTGR